MSKQHALIGPEDLTLHRLANGLQLVVRPNPSAPVAVLEGYISTGSVHDPANLAGLNSFVADLLTRGSAAYDYDTFNEQVEAVGASLTISGDTHTTGLSLAGLTEDFGLLVGLLGDALRRPLFLDEQIEQVRAQTLVYHQERAQDTHRMAGIQFYHTMYGDHPYGRPVTGYPDSVRAMTRADLVAHHARHYTPDGAILVVSGDVEPAAVIDLIEAQFGDWHGRPADNVLAAPVFADRGTRVMQFMADKMQADIVLGCPAVPRAHPDFYALRVANTVLGQFGLMGRLGEIVREELGLAYYCYSSLDVELRGGVWQASAGVNPAHVDQAIDAILQEFAHFATTPLPAAELADSQAYLTGVLPLTLETNEGTASTLLNMVWYDLGLDYLQRYGALINGITVDDVRRVASSYLRADRCVISVAGPKVE